ncbi:MAG TPA: hypothetical protein VM032_11315 [Vicinamibacterales bacterium]|nr:hypothetical protein [Vicinamibacterales bacterium]
MSQSRWQLIRTSLGRGVRKRCPHCGQGPLCSGWSLLERCSVCGLVFAGNPGDTWAITILGDRLPLGLMVVLMYLGALRWPRMVSATLLVACVALLIGTAPNRWGVGIALHYLSRLYWPEPADAIPPPWPTPPGGEHRR